ncbi:MAG: hypothetical protein AAFR87_14195 [Bacteroidota bacterium]
MKLSILLPTLLLLASGLIHAQLDGNSRGSSPEVQMELVLDGFGEDISLLSLGDQGILIGHPIDTSESNSITSLSIRDKQQWKFSKYSPDFIQIWEQQLESNRGLQYVKHFWQDEKIHLLLFQKRKGAHKRFQIISFDIFEGEYSSVEGKLVGNVKVNDFSVVKDMAYIGGETEIQRWEKVARGVATAFVFPIYMGSLKYNIQHSLTRIDLTSGESKAINYDYSKVSKTQSLAPNEWARSMSILLNHSKKKEESSIYVKEYAGNQMIRNLKLNPKSDNRLLNGRIKHLNRDDFLVLGTYAAPYDDQKWLKRFGAGITGTRLKEYAQGIYVAKVRNRGQIYIKYYSFNQFETFFDAYGKKAKEKAKKKNKKKKKKGKEVLLDVNLLIHDIEETPDSYLFLAESYIPVYEDEKTGTITTQSGKGNMAAGYKYTHAILAAFDKESGEMQWDNSFPIFNLVSPQLQTQVELLTESDTCTLIYNLEGSLQARRIHQGQILQSRQVTDLSQDLMKKKRDSSYTSQLIHWYDNYFLAWGYKNKKAAQSGSISLDNQNQPIFFYKVAY